MSKIDWTKPLETLSGYPVLEVLATDLSPPFTHCIKLDLDGEKTVRRCMPDGKVYHDLSDSQFNLRNVPERSECWVNVYRRTDGDLSFVVKHTRKMADVHASPGRIACVHVEFKEGDGL